MHAFAGGMDDFHAAYARESFLRLVRRVALIAMFACLLPGIVMSIIDLNRQEDAAEQAIPLMSQSALLAEIAKVHRELTEPPARADDYFKATHDALVTDGHIRRFIDAGGDRLAISAHLPGVGMNFDTEVMDAQNHYIAEFGDEFTRARDRNKHLFDSVLNGSGVSVQTYGGTWLVIGYLLSCLCAIGFFSAAVLLKGLNPLVDSDRVMFAAFTWPYSVFKYPVRIDVAAQVRRAKRRVGMWIAAFISIAPAGAFAKAVNGESGTASAASDTGNTLVLDKGAVPKLTGSITVKSGKVGANGNVLHRGPVYTWSVTAAYPSGWSFDFAGTKSAAGSNSSDEWDLEGYKSGTLSFGPAYTVGLHYFGIRPWHTLLHGNFAAATFSFDEPVGYGVRLFVNGEYDHVISHPHEDGYTLELGARRGFALGYGVKLNQSVSLVQAGGPFRLKSVTLGRYDASFDVPLSKETSVDVWTKLFVPLGGASHRHDGSVGVTLNYAFN